MVGFIQTLPVVKALSRGSASGPSTFGTVSRGAGLRGSEGARQRVPGTSRARCPLEPEGPSQIDLAFGSSRSSRTSAIPRTCSERASEVYVAFLRCRCSVESCQRAGVAPRGRRLEPPTMAFSVAASLEGAGTTASLRGSSSAHGAKLFQAFPALPSVRLDQRSRRLPCVRSQVADLQTIGRTDSDNKGRNGGAAVLPVEAQDSLMESASRFKAFLQSGGGHLPPGSLPQQHMELFMDFYNNYQGRHLCSAREGRSSGHVGDYLASSRLLWVAKWILYSCCILRLAYSDIFQLFCAWFLRCETEKALCCDLAGMFG